MPLPQRSLLHRHLVIATLSVLAGCAPTQQAAWDTTWHFVTRGGSDLSRPPRDDYRYLRVTSNGRPLLMVLASVEADAKGRPVEVWVGGGREVLRLQAGRLVSLIGGPVAWSRVVLPQTLPRWPDPGQRVRYRRERDELDGYLTGLAEEIDVREIPPPIQHALVAPRDQSLRWFEESVLEPAAPTPATARYAVANGDSIVYGEQCLSADLCLTWQPLPWSPKNPA